MKFRFIGNYTGERSINAGGVMFYDRAPSEVTDPDLIARLKKNPEFDHVVGPAAVPPAKKRKAKK